MDAVVEQIKHGKVKKLSKASQKVDADIELREELYIGNLHQLNNAQQQNNHSWTMFISSSPTDVVPPVTVSSVRWHLHGMRVKGL